ncbi:hypothetical protein E2I00_001483, partial [Balaenoptera physalus]
SQKMFWFYQDQIHTTNIIEQNPHSSQCNIIEKGAPEAETQLSESASAAHTGCWVFSGRPLLRCRFCSAARKPTAASDRRWRRQQQQQRRRQQQQWRQQLLPTLSSKVNEEVWSQNMNREKYGKYSAIDFFAQP